MKHETSTRAAKSITSTAMVSMLRHASKVELLCVAKDKNVYPCGYFTFFSVFVNLFHNRPIGIRSAERR